jgi:4a-hydroxytetrahydrobiopterin dehydratase
MGRDQIRYADGCMEKPKILTKKELHVIMSRLAGWKMAENKLSRTFEFQDFVQSLSFVNSLVAYFETIDHHPDVYIAYGEVTFELTRYDVGGKVTDRDVGGEKDFLGLSITLLMPSLKISGSVENGSIVPIPSALASVRQTPLYSSPRAKSCVDKADHLAQALSSPSHWKSPRLRNACRLRSAGGGRWL